MGDGSLTNTGGGFCPEAWLAAANEAARSVDAHVAQLSAAMVPEAALVHICTRGAEGLQSGARCLMEGERGEGGLTFTAPPTARQHVALRAGAGEGAGAVFALFTGLTGL